MRRTDTMTPRRVEDLAGAMAQLEQFARILRPRDAEEPILAAPVRAAVYEWLTEIRARDELAAVGIAPRATALLYGPPGCGKTTLAHHLAARLGLPLVAVDSEQIVDSKLGSSQRNAARLFDLLDQAEGQCVVLLDEIDAIGGARSKDDQACAREMNALLTVLLRKVESFRGLLIAATNREDSLDAALWRRFGLQLDVALPGPDERFAIVRRYAAPFDLADEDIDRLVDLTMGASPALLRQLMEGVKRALVLNPRLNLPTDDPVVVFMTVIAAIRPHPDYALPPLWKDRDAMAAVARLAWPPARTREAA